MAGIFGNKLLKQLSDFSLLLISVICSGLLQVYLLLIVINKMLITKQDLSLHTAVCGSLLKLLNILYLQ